MKAIRIGTRGSELALWQANTVRSLLAAAGVESELHLIKTTGDRRTDVPLSSIGGKGMFIKELEEALLADEVDLAVHSLKDVPSIIPDELVLSSFLERADPRDAWFHPGGRGIETVPEGGRIGTSSPRRRTQLRALHPHLTVIQVRGNVPTRLEKMHRGECEGMILAAAGVKRLGREDQISGFFEVDTMVPAAGQGIVGMEILRSREDLVEILARINNADAETAARCERGVLQQFGTLLDCYSSAAVHATLENDRIRMHAFFSDLEGDRAIRTGVEGARTEADDLVRRLAHDLKARGAEELLESALGAGEQ